MPFDDTSRRLPVRRYSIATGHPPVLMQIADQVRCATGYTLGRATVEGARQVLLARAAAPTIGAPVKPASAPVPTAAAPVLPAAQAAVHPGPGRAPSAQMERLLDVLHGFAARGETLPGSTVLAERAQIVPAYVATAIHRLAARGLLREWQGDGARGAASQRIVVLLPSGAVLRTAGAPAGIVP